MFIDLFSHHHVKSRTLARRQLLTSEGEQLEVDQFVPEEASETSETPSNTFAPTQTVRRPVANAAQTPTYVHPSICPFYTHQTSIEMDSTLPSTVLPTPTESLVPAQGVPQPLLGLDSNPDRPEIVTILSGMCIISVFVVLLLFVLPLFQSRKRRDNRLCYVSEDDPDSMAGLSRFGYTQYLDPPSPWQNPRKSDASLPAMEEEENPMERHRPPGLNFAPGAMTNVPLAPPSPRSGGLPSNPRSGLPSAHAYGGTFRDKTLRPMSGVVTWRVQEPMEAYAGYAFDMGRYNAGANMVQPPAPSFRQSIRDSIVSHLSFGRKNNRASAQITRGDMMQVDRDPYHGNRYI